MAYFDRNAPQGANENARDPRWQMLRFVQEAKDHWSLRDRDIAVLRGLLSLVAAQDWAEGRAIFVYASNKVLQERCDGMDERTLRRRLQKLCEAGLIQRRISPNRKRYIIRDETGALILSYGFDLSPLRKQAQEIADLAGNAKQERQRITALRKVLRDRLWHLAQAGIEGDASYQPLLRNKISSDELSKAVQAVEKQLAESTFIAEISTNLTDSDSQIVRDIHNSNKENLYKEPDVITLNECIEKAPLAVEYAPWSLNKWDDVEKLTDLLGPALDIKQFAMNKARALIGRDNTTAIIMGMIQAGNHIRRPAQYFNTLLRKAEAKRLNIREMYNSLTRDRSGFRPETQSVMA